MAARTELREKLQGCHLDLEKTVDFVWGKQASDVDSMTIKEI